MAEAINDLIQEVLNAVQTRVVRIDTKVDEVELELHAILGHQLAIPQDVDAIHSRLGHFEDRVERVEVRLGLAEPAH